MIRQKYRKPIGKIDYRASFPYQVYPEIRPGQDSAFDYIEENDGRVTLEGSTGTGKTEILYTFLKALENAGLGPLFYIVPTKALVDQVKRRYPDLAVVYGRREHQCLYYPDKEYRADEIPCLTLVKCPHRVNQETGVTLVPGATPCPYYQQKFEARKAKIVVSTMAFYLFHQLFPSKWEEPAGLAIDEAHDIAKVVRGALSFEITDWHLGRACELLERIDERASEKLKGFLKIMIRIVKRKPSQEPTLLEDDEIIALMKELEGIDSFKLEEKLQRAVENGEIDEIEERITLRQIEVIIRDLRKYLHSMEYSLPGENRHALNYTYAYYQEEKEEGKRVQYKLVIKAHYVAGLIAKILAPRTVAVSATIGKPEIFAYETGIRSPVYSIPPEFPVENARIYMPRDTRNLAERVRSRQDLNRELRRIVEACRKFARHGIRSLVVVTAEKERQKFMEFAIEVNLDAVSYGNGSSAREVAARFRDGLGDVLVGTQAQYGEGIDLPKKTAPVIFMLKPGYGNPRDPASIFEEKRKFLGNVWAIINWRVAIKALQVRGRNIRSAEDIGVCFFISQHFRNFLFGSLPEWLKPAYRGEMSFEESVAEALSMLK